MEEIKATLRQIADPKTWHELAAKYQLRSKLFRYYVRVTKLFDLTDDFDEPGARESILANIEFRSGNAWALVFAILIASIGLHVSSTAIIIGAMLISPLMGPIVGAGFALGIHDIEVLKRSLRNLGYAVLISIFTSTVFFLFTPESSVQSELIARTQPNFYDVLIALFGGATGIVANTRRSKGTAIPGVAIATALMPPLCTIGFGLANFKLGYSLGALYLFTINTAFIFVSTYIFVRLLKFKETAVRDTVQDKAIHKWMGVGASLLIIPSLVLVWHFHQKAIFEHQANQFIETVLDEKYILFGKSEVKYQFGGSFVKVNMLTDEPKAQVLSDIEKLAEKQGSFFSDTQFSIEVRPRDSFSLQDLNDAYISKSEFLNFQESLKQKQAKLTELRLNRGKADFKQRYKSKFDDLRWSIDSGGTTSIEVAWKKDPTAKEKTYVEEKLYALIAIDELDIQHSLVAEAP